MSRWRVQLDLTYSRPRSYGLCQPDLVAKRFAQELERLHKEVLAHWPGELPHIISLKLRRK
jgi:hypothetical protein